MDRRTALQRIGLLLGAAVSAQTAAAVLSGCRARGAGYTARALSADAYESLGQVADVILPPTDTPGATDARVPEFIDTMLMDYYPESDRMEFLEGFDLMRAVLDESPQGAFASLTDADRGAVLEQLDAAAFGAPGGGVVADRIAATYRRLKESVVVGYYTSEIGATQELNVNPMGIYQGDMPLSEAGRTWA